jgi:methionyl-tRNA formyltransferase
MGSGWRVIVASYGPIQFQALHEILSNAGHLPVAYLVSRSLRPSANPEPDILAGVKSVLDHLPAGIDLLLPGSAQGVAHSLVGYAPDLLLVFGFNWALPRQVLDLPRFGALNVHPSALPRYRGPSPELWAIRNGDTGMGLSVHRMTERIDAWPVLAQVSDLPIPDEVTRQDIWELQKAALPSLLATAFDRVSSGDPGAPQNEKAVTHASFPPPEWFTITWKDGRHDTHNQVRVLRYIRGRGPTARLQGHEVRIARTSLTDDGGTRVDCCDGPLWVTLSPVGS